MGHDGPVEWFDTVVVGGGQAGLAMGCHLARQGREFVILDAGERVGDAWRGRWDSLRLFSPAAFNALPGMPFPAPNRYFPTKDETADYLEEYVRKFDLPVRLGRQVDSLRGYGEGYLVSTGEERCLAQNVVVATGPNHTPRVPEFARRLDPSIVQLHSSRYRNPGQLPEGDALVVGVGNSGAEISVELSASRHTYLSGREAGNIPVILPRDYISRAAYAGIVASLWIINRALNVDTRAGRKLKEYDRRGGSPLARLSPKDIARAGVERVPRVEGVVDGRPELADGRVLEVASVVWATGFKADFGWIELPVFEEDGSPLHYRGVVEGESGLYFLGLPFQYTITSAFIDGVGRDARHIADDIAGRTRKQNDLLISRGLAR
jgi:putative flavoprotein involved in K+ transport